MSTEKTALKAAPGSLAFFGVMALTIGLGLFSCGGEPAEEPEVEPAIEVAGVNLYERDVSGGIHDIAPIRGERGPLGLHRDGDVYECTMCHDEFAGDLSADALQGEHSDFTFDHGLNLLCLNCHHSTNPDVFVQHDGSEIPGDEPTLLCAKCHGPHYREWRKAVHGRVNGVWDPRYGEQKKLECIQCHDPHRPKFPPMVPFPPPVHTRFDLGQLSHASLGQAK